MPRLHPVFLLALLACGLAACVPLPSAVLGPVSGRVVDARSGRPVPGARVALAAEGRYDDVLPERRLLGAARARTDESGRFEVRLEPHPALVLWPWMRTETRVVAVEAPGYRCPESPPHSARGDLVIALERALDESDRALSCRVPEPAGPAGDAAAGSDPMVDDALAARSLLGFGANCRGPVDTLSLSPDGERVAFVTRHARGTELRLVGLGGAAPTRPRVVARTSDPTPPPLRWMRSGALTLEEPGAPGGLAMVWRPPTPPASLSPEGAPSDRPDEGASPAEERHDGAALRWAGRRFRQTREVDPASGLARETLHVIAEDGSTRAIELPGEPCTVGGSFGRPQDRIAADRRTALDLRWVAGGCRVVAIDLETGAWRRLDGTQSAGTCRTSRRVPLSVLERAARGYALDVAARLTQAGLDPGSAFTLWITPGAAARATARDLDGRAHSVAIPRFPMQTPLERLQITATGAAGAPASGAEPRPRRWQPL